MNEVLSTGHATQLAISLVNRPGMLARICQALAEAQINIHALTVIEVWGENSTVRIVVSDAERATTALRQAGITAMETDVLMIEARNKPGALAAIAERLAAAGINIEYAYLSASEGADTSCMIVRPSDVEKAQQILA
jgi:hypothetical protein